MQSKTVNPPSIPSHMNVFGYNRQKYNRSGIVEKTNIASFQYLKYSIRKEKNAWARLL